MTASPDPIRFHVAHTPAKAASYVLEALEANENVNGTFTQRCSSLIEERFGVPKVLITHSATAALEVSAMLLAAERGAGKVFMPSFTFSSTANAYLRAGYELEFVDIDPATMSPGTAEFAAAAPPRGSVVVPVHYAGNPGDIDEIEAWANTGGILVAEDGAQSFGSALGGRWAGTFGPVAAISFHYTKNVHSSMGGALFINDAGLVDTATYMWERGTNRQALLKGLVDKYSWVTLGSSFQSTEIQAALLLAGLEEYDEILARRRVLWEGYAARLGDLEGSGLHIQSWRPEAVNNFHAFFVRLESAEAADSLRETLLERAIQAYIGYVPLHNSPYGTERRLDRPLPLTEKWAACVLRLPLHTAMDLAAMERVSGEVLAWLDRR
ncbi:MAG TPA: DegT/DnrJ/EryC1/StrS family aminotransferase [Acidimicrobiia bacterium]|jgi:dTDP-4-amino-4,6-dideoxygalactose transaminase